MLGTGTCGMVTLTEATAAGVSAMNPGQVRMPHFTEDSCETATEREALVQRVAASHTFERSPRLRAFLQYVCQCALYNQPEAMTEQQIGIHVYDRPPGYNPNEDNIVRSQARLLRMKLEHYFATEGKDSAVVITIPKGRYLPVFDPRSEMPSTQLDAGLAGQRKPRRMLAMVLALAALFGLATFWLGHRLFESRPAASRYAAAPAVSPLRPAIEARSPARNQPPATAGSGSEIRIAAGHAGVPYVDAWGHRWEADLYFEGGNVQPGPRHFFPPVRDPGMFRTIREAVSADMTVPQSQRQFRYDIPVRSGAYELRLFFADPLRQPDVDQKEDAQNIRHLHINLNGHPLLVDFDPIADAGSASVDVRVFRDVYPTAEGKIHLEFLSSWGKPAFVSALELTPGTPGKLKPIRLCAQRSGFVDGDGTQWSGDNYFIGGRTALYANPESRPKVPALYTVERYGNFSYAIPVAPGSYTVKLHFLDSFFSPLIPEAGCTGAGCRVFDVACNGVMLLQDFDIVQAAGGPFRPAVREFHGLHPNGQGKLLLSFSSRVNYAEIRAIEVVDEGR